jgi:hypothetical protein
MHGGLPESPFWSTLRGLRMVDRGTFTPWPAFLAGGLLVLGMASCSERAEVIARQRQPAGGGHGGDTTVAGGRGGVDDEVRRPVFAAPTPIEELNDPDAKDQDPTLTEDLCEILFFSDRGGNDDIWTSRRDRVDDPWEPPTPVAELNSDSFEQSPAISRDGLRLWYYSRRDPPGIWFSARETREATWSEPIPIPIEVDEPEGVVIAPALDDVELRMAVSVGTSSSRDIYEMVRQSWAAPWGDPAPVAGLNVDTADSTPFLIDDGSEILLSSGRSGAGDLFWGYRVTPALAVERVEALVELNDEVGFESHPHLAVDRTVIFFGSNRTGNTDIYQAFVAE